MSKERILIYRLGSLGDTIMALPCFHLIKNRYPDADITLLTNKPVAHKAAPIESVLGESSFFFDRVINYPIGTRNFFLLLSIVLKIRKLNISTVINISSPRSKAKAFRDRIFFQLAGVKTIIGNPERDEDFEIKIDEATGDYEWEAKRLANRIIQLGLIDLSDSNYWDLKLSKEEQNEATNVLYKLPNNYQFICVCVGTKMSSKDWGIDNWLL